MNYFSTSKLAAYLGIIFIAGAASGSVITLNHARSHPAQVPSMDKTCTRLQDRLTSKLDLTPEQVRKLQPVFDQTAQELRTVHANALQDTDAILRRAHQQIACALSLDQKLKLGELEKEREEWLRRRLEQNGTPRTPTKP